MGRRLGRMLLTAVVAFGAVSCHRDTRAPRTCVVLSVGGTKGLAHVGALEALEARGVPIDCVVGNSMGAVVGSLYAAAPGANLRQRYRAFFTAYEDETRKVAATRGAVGAAVGLLAVLISGGTLGPAVAAGALGAAGGAATVPPLSHERFTQVLDSFYAGARVEELPVPFATFHQEPFAGGIRLVTVTRGPLAEAVSASASNPLLFKDATLEHLDPGADRVSATPVHDACQLFPGARLIAINVTGEPAFYRPDLGCDVREVRVDVAMPPVEAFTGRGPAFEATYDAGRDAVMRARLD
ncbi:patatin-like phospholipase family protein [Corallococcus sp. RDP092CA]|uniref:patatin-like phospholipase family protein n=1 Tax=Corallococcus sp. RDP092CA TaxID=3109369 RepID=UPI0035B34060